MALDEPFTTASPILASYDYFDIADGTGIQNFYLAQSEDTGATTYYLTTDNTTYSANITEVHNVSTGGASTMVSDLDYDVTFNIPKIIEGKARCSISQGVYNKDGGTEIFLILNLYHVESNGTTEVLMATATTVTTVTASAPVTYSETKNVEFDCARQHFKQGEILRLSVEHWKKSSAAGNPTGYGVDPQDRNEQAALGRDVILDIDTTQAKIAIPFIIET